ncbi:MAG: NAD-dependent epimerase/dehydratase family protein [Candidatus Saccharimonadales bacterium]
MIQNSEILVTGGFGFIGAHLAQSLADPDLGNSLTLIDNNVGTATAGHELGLAERENITVVEGCVVEAEVYDELPRNFDFIVSAAGYLGINEVAEQQLLTLETNIDGTRNSLEFAAEHEEGEKPFVLVFSTSEIYGSDAHSPSEDSPAVIPSSGERWCYASSKLANEYFLRAFNQSQGVPGAIVRPFNVYGPHRYGSNAMTKLVRRAVDGDDLNISGDGMQVRSWCHIDDFCDGAMRILKYSPEGIEAYNIGDDMNVFTMSGLARAVVLATGSRSAINILGIQTEDVRHRVPNIDKARTLLGYRPRTRFEDGLDQVIEWVRSTGEMELRDAA